MTAHSQKGRQIEELARDYYEAKTELEKYLDPKQFYRKDIETAEQHIRELARTEGENFGTAMNNYIKTANQLERQGLKLNDTLTKRINELGKHIKLKEDKEKTKENVQYDHSVG